MATRSVNKVILIGHLGRDAEGVQGLLELDGSVHHAASGWRGREVLAGLWGMEHRPGLEHCHKTL